MRRLDGVYTLGIVLVSRPVRRVGLFAVVLATLLGLAASSFNPQTTLGETGSASATRLWSSGAELNSTTAGMEVTSTSGTISINGTTKRSGDYAFRANPTSSTGLFTKVFAASNQSNKFWFRTYILIASTPTADTYVVRIGNSGGGKISVRMTTSGTLLLRNEEDNTDIGSASSALSTNTWYRVEVFVDTTTLSSTDADLRLDGASIGSSIAENLASGIDRMVWGSTATGTTDLYFDDIAINDSTGRAVDNWPGEGRIVHMQVNATGDNTAWTGDNTDVDEVTPNDSTDYISSETNDQLEDNNLESASSAGLAANDTVKLVQVGQRYRRCASGLGGPNGPGGGAFFFVSRALAATQSCPHSGSNINNTHRLRIKAAASGTVEETGNLTDTQTAWITNDNSVGNYALSLYDLPGTSTAPWTPTDLDSTQIGVNLVTADPATDVTTLWLLVEYVDRSGGRLISSGFELNSASAGVELSAVTNTPAINSSTFRSGTYALTTENGGAQEYARFYFESANTNNDYYARAYLRIATTLNSSTATVLSLLDTSNLRRAYIKLTTTSTLELWDEDGQIGSASSALSTNTWYRVELRMNTAPSAGSHVVDGRLDGSSFASASNRSIGTGVARLGIGINASDSVEASSNTQGSIIWDDVAVNKGVGTSQNSWPGDGAIIHLYPNATGDNSETWASTGSGAEAGCDAGADSNYECLDEVVDISPITPDDAVSYVEETTSGDYEDFNIQDSPISGSDVISLVSVGVRFRTSSATREDFRVRVKDASNATAIESNTLSPASTTWTTNATADPKLYPLTAYTRPERSTAWTDTTLDSAQIGMRDVLSGTGTVQVSTAWLLVEYAPPPTIIVSGTCDQYDQTTDCVDDGANSIAVAVNGTIQAQSDATVDGAWSIEIVTPNAGDVITVFIDGEATDSEEANAVTVYDGSGNITGIKLFYRHLTIGSDDNQTITNTNLSQYDNSVSADEDIFFDVSAGNDLTIDSLASYTDEELYIDSGDTFRPASGGGADVTTVDVENLGTWTADSNAISVGGSWLNSSVFTAGTSTVTFTSTTTGRTIAGDLASPNGFNDVIFNGTGGEWTNTSALGIANDLTMTAGTFSGTSGVTVRGNVQGTNGVINRTGATFKLGASASKNFGTTSGSTAWTFSSLTFANDLGVCTGITYTTQTGGTGGITVTGILNIGESGDGVGCTTTLNAGNRTWTLSGTGGDPLQLLASPAAVLTASTSTFTYTGNNAGGNTTIEGNLGVNGYYNLTVNNALETYVLEIDTGVGNDLNVTNGVLNTTASNYALNVTRDLILANTAGVGLIANGSTITVSRDWNDSGGKFTRGTSTVNLNGTGSVLGGALFNNLNIAYATKTTTFLAGTIQTYGTTSVNGGTLSGTSVNHFHNCSASCTPFTFNSPTTLTGTNSYVVLSPLANSVTITISGGDYGSWHVYMKGGNYSNTVYNLGGNIINTGSIYLYAYDGTTPIFNTQNHSITTLRTIFGYISSPFLGTFTANFGSSNITYTNTGDALYVQNGASTHNINLQSSHIDTKGNILFINGSGTINVDSGTSTLTWTHTSGTKTYAPNGQSLYNLTINATGTVQPTAAVDVNNDFTITSGTYDTVSGSNHSLSVGGNFTNSGTFTARAGTVALDGTSTQTLSGTLTGSSAFYNLTVTNSSGASASDNERTGFVASVDFNAAATVTNNYTITTANTRIEYNSGSTYTFTNINWNGQASGTRIYFRNSAVSGSWNLNVSGTQTAVSYVNVSRSNASSGNTIVANDGTNFDGSNNVNWSFSNPNTPTSLAQKKTNDTVISTGGWTNETSVKFTANISDGDNPATIQLCVERELISVPFVNTETSCGSTVSYTGTAVAASVTIGSLTDTAEYHWQARVKDSGGAYSSWVAYGGNLDNDPADRDYGVDTTACTYAGSIYDGDTEDVDAAFNDGSLEELMANWDDFSCGASGILRYEVSVGTTAGGTDILSWVDNGSSPDSTQAGLNLHTNQYYYYNVRAVDNASNTSSVFSSNGQQVLPTISLVMGSTTLTFSNLNDNNNRTDSKTLNLTTSTNAYGGYVIRQYATGLLTNGASTIPMFQGGTYASPGSWPGSFCASGANCGYGYTSNDTTIQGANKFSTGTLYAAFATAAFGDIVADHTTAVTGATGPVTNEALTITHKVSVDALQTAKTYQTEVFYIVTGTF